ncbi:MAG: glutaredoxin 3 [Alphaproteobacteria bacterium]|nr:glutaredoxin 3 [Alphaproteobacteria bacterium]
MPEITIYTTELCPYCRRAKALLEQKGAAYHEIDVTYDPGMRATMAQRAGGIRTVPQIFIGSTHVGGCDEIYALEAKGGLDPLLARA